METQWCVVCSQLAGAMAEEGRPLKEIVAKVTEAAKGIGESNATQLLLGQFQWSEAYYVQMLMVAPFWFVGTLGVSLSPCSVPGCLPSFQLPPGEMELGLGE